MSLCPFLYKKRTKRSAPDGRLLRIPGQKNRAKTKPLSRTSSPGSWFSSRKPIADFPAPEF